MSITYVGILSEILDEYDKVLEKEYFIKCINSNYEFRFILGVSYIGKCDIRIVNNFRECILDIIPNTREDCFNIFTEMCGDSELIKIILSITV